MRINVYSEELTGEATVVPKYIPETGKVYYGARVFLASPDTLHHAENDDDRSAVTFWYESGDKAAAIVKALQ